MKDGLLYFPHINVPKSDWLIRSLLYWEKVGTIIPQDHLNNPDEYLNNDMCYLLSEYIIVPVMPQQYIENAYSYEQNFIKIIESKRDMLERKRNGFSTYTNYHSRVNGTQKIHSEKMNITHPQITDEQIKTYLLEPL